MIAAYTVSGQKVIRLDKFVNTKYKESLSRGLEWELDIKYFHLSRWLDTSVFNN